MTANEFNPVDPTRLLRAHLYLLTGCLCALCYPFFAYKASHGDWWYIAVSAFGLIGTIWGVWVNAPTRKTPWQLFLAARALIFFSLFIDLGADAVRQPGSKIMSQEGLILLALPLLIFSFFTFISARGTRLSRQGMNDGLLVFLGLSVIAWEFVIPMAVMSSGETPLQVLAHVVFPLASFAVLGLLVWLSTEVPLDNVAFRLLIVGSVCYALAELVNHSVLGGDDITSPWIQTLWLASKVTWGAASMHPSMSALGQIAPTRKVTFLSRGRLTLLAFATLALPFVLLWRATPNARVDQLGIIVVSLSMTILIWLRVRALVDQINAYARSMKRQSLTDSLTGLGNRRYFESQYQTLEQEASDGVALMLIDVDRFKSINDTYGHPVGDQLLKQTADRMREQLAQQASLTRLGGDEFAVLTRNTESLSVAEQAWSLQRCFVEPFLIDALRIRIGVSIGTAMAPRDGETLDTLTTSADTAMRLAKLRLTQVETFAPEVDESERSRAALLADFPEAVRRGQLTVHYQPKVDLRTSKVIGMEALVRWNHPVRGRVAPGLFVPAIEKTELIRDLTKFVLNQAVANCASWSRAGHPMTVAVNISTRNLLDDRLRTEIGWLLNEHHLSANRLELEITESAALAEPDRAIAALAAIRKLGVQLSIDDYGTGYGSISYLERLPVHVVKMDGRFVRNLKHNKSNQLIVRSTISLARELNLEVVAECVEDEETLRLLESYGCFLIQGFHISAPVEAESVLDSVLRVERTMLLPRINNQIADSAE